MGSRTEFVDGPVVNLMKQTDRFSTKDYNQTILGAFVQQLGSDTEWLNLETGLNGLCS